jgi:arylsulfatase A-like enzyme
MCWRNASLVLIAVLMSPRLAIAAGERPNVIIVLTDDQGYGDLSCHGNPTLKTPNLDRLHGQSVRLTDFHVSPMCTPTRSQLMTGRDALDNGGMNVSSGRTMIRRGIPTMAELFAKGGYRTGLFGKWHLGDVYPYRPQDRGFHKALWFPSSHIPSAPDVWNNDYFDTTYRTETGELWKLPGYCADVQFEQAMQWMEQTAAAKQPFLAYVALNSAHWPWWVPDGYRERYRNLDKDFASFFAMVANIDHNMGRLEAMLQRTGLRDNTILIFMTDNGGTVGVKHFNAGMKAGKVTLWDGGHRVPMFIRWPAGNLGEPRDVDALTHVQDVLPTLINLCSLEAPANPKFDGVTLAPLLRGTQPSLPDRMLVVQFSRMSGAVPQRGDAAVLWKKWRLLVKNGELYDVATDLAQERNVAKNYPDVVAAMRKHYDGWWADVEPRVNVLSRLVIGSDAEPLTLLSPADWQDLLLDQQMQVRTALARNSHWNLEVARDGEYTFELRRWPREADLPLRAGAPPLKGVDGELPPGKALAIAEARLKVGDAEFRAPVGANDKLVRISLPLTKGDVQAQTWFYDDAGKELCGAYYVYVERK